MRSILLMGSVEGTPRTANSQVIGSGFTCMYPDRFHRVYCTAQSGATSAEDSGVTTVPSADERAFDIDELFVSTTDLKGHIRMTNHVFVRVSGYEREELIGRAHNVI